MRCVGTVLSVGEEWDGDNRGEGPVRGGEAIQRRASGQGERENEGRYG